MAEWFESKVSYLRQMDNGLIKKVTEQYLVDSCSFTECEARVIAEQGEGIREVTVAAIKRSNIKEVVFYGDTDQWFKVKVQYSVVDEDTEKEKKVTTYLLVNANDAKEAYERTEEHLKEMLVPFSIPKVEESPIVDVFQYQNTLPRKTHVTDKVEDLKTEAALALTQKLIQRRDEVKQLFRDNYAKKVAEWTPIVEAVMKGDGFDSPFAAVLAMSEDKDIDEMTGSLLIAVAVEMSESKMPSPINRQSHDFGMFIADDWAGKLPEHHRKRLKDQFRDLYKRGRKDEFMSWFVSTHGVDNDATAVIEYLDQEE